MTGVPLPTGAGTFFHHMFSKCLWAHACSSFWRCTKTHLKLTTYVHTLRVRNVCSFTHISPLCLHVVVPRHRDDFDFEAPWGTNRHMCLGVSCVYNFLFAEYCIQIIWKPWLWIESLFNSLGKVELFNLLLLPSFMSLFLFSSSLWWGVDKLHILMVLSLFLLFVITVLIFFQSILYYMFFFLFFTLIY